MFLSYYKSRKIKHCIKNYFLGLESNLIAEEVRSLVNGDKVEDLLKSKTPDSSVLQFRNSNNKKRELRARINLSSNSQENSSDDIDDIPPLKRRRIGETTTPPEDPVSTSCRIESASSSYELNLLNVEVTDNNLSRPESKAGIFLFKYL